MKAIDKSPSRFAFRFLAWFCPASLYESIEGDLLEQFEEDAKAASVQIAQRRFIWNVVKFFRPEILLRNRFSFQLIQTIMLRSYFKITYRTIIKSKGYSFINIFGLSLGIACCLLTFNYVRYELSYDRNHPDVDRTFRVDQTLIWSPEGGVFGSTGLPLANLLVTDYPEVEAALRVNTTGDFVMRYADDKGKVTAFNEAMVLAADSNFFSFFDFKLKEGDAATALKGINKVVISDKAAKKFFGDELALGKTLLWGNERTALEVSGVTEAQPGNAHFHFDYLLSMYTNPNIKKNERSWIWTQVVTYVRLRSDADAKSLEQKMASIGEKTIKPSFEMWGINYDEFLATKGKWSFYLRPVTDIHLKSQDNRLGSVGDIKYAYTFAMIGIFVLLIAAINFINLSTARGTMRAKEVGVKKTLGALRSSLISQFQSESIFLAAFSTFLALILVEGFRLLIVLLVRIDIPFSLWQDKQLLMIIPFIPIVIGVLAGLYPSFYLTSFRPSQILKGKVASGMGNSRLRSTLVVTQFTISIALMAGTIIVFQQLKFMGSSHLGFNKENILLIDHAEKLDKQLESFRDEIATYPGVVASSITMAPPGRGRYEDIFSSEGSSAKLPISQIKIDESYFKSMGFELVAGRSFEKERPSDINAVIANETTVRLFGWTPEKALGKYIIYPGNDYSKHEIIGVVKDFHFQSLRESIAPLLFGNIHSTMWGDSRVLAVKFQSADIKDLTTRIEKRWNSVLDDTPIEFTFLDTELEKQYLEEQRLAGLFGIFSGLSILIAVIGLVGLVAYSAEVRKKEIGIRKVFGASMPSIFMMINTQYVKLMIIAVIIASPFAWWVLNQWLTSFAYHIQLNPIVFVICGIAEIAISIVCVSYLSMRAAGLNPAKVLKEE
jgi:putative ABC transport system permease protein